MGKEVMGIDFSVQWKVSGVVSGGGVYGRRFECETKETVGGLF